MKVAPSLLSADFTDIRNELKKISSADYIHCDVMDGHFVPNITFGPFIIKQIKQHTNIELDVHLMIKDPDRYIKDFIDAGASIITVHFETCVHIQRTLSMIRKYGARSGICFNPGTDIQCLKYLLDDIDLVLIMSVNPGFGGQRFIPSSLKKISDVKNIIGDRNIELQVDGGVCSDNIKDIAEAGANVVVAGSYIFSSDDYSSAIKSLKV